MAGYIGSKASVVSSGVENKKVITATAGQTSFTGLTYSPNRVHVFQNGVRLVDGTDYTATDGNSLTLTVGALADDQVVVVSYSGFQTSDTVSSSAGGTFTGDVNFTGAFTSQGIDDNANATAITIDSSENVGIGTSSPSANLDVASSNATIHLTDTDDTTYAEIRNNGGTFTIASDEGAAATNSSINFRVDATERMRIDSSGNVGIGNTNPTHNLHVTDTGTPNVVIETTALSGADAKLRIRGSRTTSVDGNLAQILFETNDESSAGDTLAFITAGKDVASTNKGVIRFGTTTTDGGSASEHMRINSNGETIIDQLSITGSSRIIQGYESGHGSILTGTSAASYSTYSQASADTVYIVTQTINFANAFSGPPKVFVYQYDGNTSGHGSIMRFWADNVTSSGFTLVTSDTAGSSTVGINWIAIRDSST